MHGVRNLILGIAASQFCLYSNAEVKCDTFGNGMAYNGLRVKCHHDNNETPYYWSRVSGLEECIYLCNEDPVCQTARYYDAGPNCYLRSGTLQQFPAVPVSYYDLVTKIDPRTCQGFGDGQDYDGFTAKCEYDTSGPFYRQLDVVDFKNCIDRCAAETRCKSAAYYARDNHCYLKERTWKESPPFRLAGRAVFEKLDPKSCRGFGHGQIRDGYRAKCGFDGGGPFYRSLEVADFSDCLDKCDADEPCRSIGYVDNQSGRHVCYLKRGAWEDFDIYPKSNTDFAAQLDPASCQGLGDGQTYNDFVTKCDADDGGPFYRQLDATDFKDCINKCRADLRCQFVGYYDKDRHCYLKEGSLEKFPPRFRLDNDFASRLPSPTPTPTPSCTCWVIDYLDSSKSMVPIGI